MKSKFVFAYVDNWFDVLKYKFIIKSGSSKFWLFFPHFCGRHKK